MTFAVYSFLIAQKQILFFILTVILALRCGTAILAGANFMPCFSDEAAVFREKAEIRSKRSVPTHNSGLIFQRMNSAFVRSENKNAPGGAVRISIMSVRKSAAFQYAGKCGLIRVRPGFRSFGLARHEIQLSTGHIRRGILCLSAMFMV